MKYIKKILKYIATGFLVFLVSLCLYTFIVTDILKKDYVNVFGYSYFVVATGSMSGYIEVNDIIFVKLDNNVKHMDIDDVITNIMVTPGTKLIQTCPVCGEEVTSNIRFPNSIKELFSYESKFKKFGKKYGFADFHPHKLRHSSASIAITSGADVVSVSERLGHSNTAVTLNTYAHANEESIRRAGQIVRDALKQKEG